MAKIDAIILDWAGTTMDFLCYAPVVVFGTIFEKYSVPIQYGRSKEACGRPQKVHLRKITEIP